MEALCLDVLNSDWHDFRHPDEYEDHLLQEGWLEQLAIRWGFPISQPPDKHTLAAFQSLRTMMQQALQTLFEEHRLSEQTLAALNTYLETTPHILQLITEGEGYQLQRLPLAREWNGVLGEVVISFATLLAQNPARIKQCENPECRWIYYDESDNQSRRWCEDACANLMRVRRFRAKQRKRA
ncbi:CGNR zinc finger domain-containing protein [Ktedonosporobacter rubrisoli]|uniref:CGNR zinc finger domain-containing protein n=1 Tax=Ktedonosporobacter rubrisoli TaxID=2509675 RepID=A0A4P6JR55_KTERU|nr:CGNR zinc finger domain-containing protein [Ktedonosporobacter rubrisoli]QBD77763.1 CGNR zinc finger domain-containing protein [Ktedonosporobacter rubrisoli]